MADDLRRVNTVSGVSVERGMQLDRSRPLEATASPGWGRLFNVCSQLGVCVYKSFNWDGN